MIATAAPRPSLADIAKYFLMLGATGFGGPVALADYIRRDLVQNRAWLSEEEYKEGLAIATACPGPLAYQLGVYCGFVLKGFWGALVTAISFAFAPFLIVVALASLYSRFAGSWQLRALFYGIGPVIIAIIVKACWNLGVKTIGRNVIALAVAIVACAITVIVKKELTVLFIAAGVLGIFIFTKRVPKTTPPTSQTKGPAPALALSPTLYSAFLGPSAGMPAKLFAFFFKTGFLVFGSGLVIVPFLQTYLVDQYGWLTQQQFVDAVAIGLMSPGPVVITATFVGYLLSGFAGAAAATAGIFMPSILFTVVGTPLLRRYRANPRLQGFVVGITVAVVGVLVGTSYLVGQSVVVDWLTALLALAALGIGLFAKRVPDQLVVASGAIVGLLTYPLLHPALMVK
jgi:chromate transporter